MLPEAPAVLAALCALHSGETAVAASVLKAAVAAGQGGDSMRPRLYLLQAWCAMQQDNTKARQCRTLRLDRRQ